MLSKLKPGDIIVVYAHSPREKVWGQLLELQPAGVNLYGIDLAAFDDWLSSLLNDEGGFGLTNMFLPLWRIERILLDQAVGGIQSIEDQLRNRLGLSLAEFIQASQGEAS